MLRTEGMVGLGLRSFLTRRGCGEDDKGKGVRVFCLFQFFKIMEHYGTFHTCSFHFISLVDAYMCVCVCVSMWCI